MYKHLQLGLLSRLLNGGKIIAPILTFLILMELPKEIRVPMLQAVFFVLFLVPLFLLFHILYVLKVRI